MRMWMLMLMNTGGKTGGEGPQPSYATLKDKCTHCVHLPMVTSLAASRPP